MAAGSLIGISWYPAGTQCPLSTLPVASSNTNNPLGPCMVHFTGESGFGLVIQLGKAGLWVLALCCYVQQLNPHVHPGTLVPNNINQICFADRFMHLP